MNLYGASGHAKVILEILIANNEQVDHIYDDNAMDKTSLLGYPVENPSKSILQSPIIIAIGDNAIRMRIAQYINCDFGTAISSSSIISRSAHIQRGTVVMSGAIINSSSEIGEHSIINTGASVDHDCRVGNYVHISPHATLCGSVTVGDGTWIGAGAVVTPGIKIGRWCRIGAGAVVIRDIPDFCVAVGVPSKIINSYHPIG